jgi:hypothetical protein
LLKVRTQSIHRSTRAARLQEQAANPRHDGLTGVPEISRNRAANWSRLPSTLILQTSRLRASMNDNELIGPVNGIGEIAHLVRQRAGSLRTSTNVSSDEFQRNFIAIKAPNPVDDQEQLSTTRIRNGAQFQRYLVARSERFAA